MAAIGTARRSRLHNATEGLALTTILQSFRSFAAAFLLKLVGNPGVAIFVATASLAYAMLAGTMGPSIPAFSRPSMSQSSSRPICRCPTRSRPGAPSRRRRSSS